MTKTDYVFEVSYENKEFIFNCCGWKSKITSYHEVAKAIEKIADADRKRDSFFYDGWAYKGANRLTKIKDGSFQNFMKDYPYFFSEEEIEEMYTHIDGNYYHYYRNNFFGENKDLFTFFCMHLFVTEPQFEQLIKTHKFYDICSNWVLDANDQTMKRCFKKGKNIDEITGMNKNLWKTLTENTKDVKVWNEFRVWNNQIKKAQKQNGEKEVGLTKELVETIYNLNMSFNDLKKFRKLIKNAVDNEGNPVFTINKLANYLERLDMYQAIPQFEAIEILTDYVMMCNHLDITPIVDSDSLKREHDVTARNHRTWEAEKREAWEAEKGSKFTKRAESLSKYEYKEAKLKVIVPRTITDLITEGQQNRNCVGSYVDNFANGRSNIFFIRKNDSPDKSYITVELNSSCTEVRQAYYACNRRIENANDLGFIHRWLQKNREVV